MAWATPPTFSSGNVLTAAQLNILSGDLNETAVAKATSGGQWFFSTAANTMVARTPAAATTVGGDQSTSSSTFTDLTTVGPAVTLTTGTTAMVFFSAFAFHSSPPGSADMSYAISGASTIAAGTFTGSRVSTESAASTAAKLAFTKVNWVTGLTAGSNTFTMKYLAVGGVASATFNNRDILVVPAN